MHHPFVARCQSSVKTDQPLSQRTLASYRSLVINTHTSDSVITAVLETLTQSIRLNGDNTISVHYTLKLLVDLASKRPKLIPTIFEAVRSKFLSSVGNNRISTESLAALVSISDLNNDLNIELDHEFFVSLSFSPCVSSRLWLLRNAQRFCSGLYVLLPVFLGLTKDPFPYVRKLALDGLFRLCKSDVAFDDTYIVEACYCRGVALLRDDELYVRAAAIRVVSLWGHMLIASRKSKNARECAGTIFVQLGSMVRDMSTEVRVEAFNALGKVGVISDSLLLQALSKKALGRTKEKKYRFTCVTESFETSASGAAGIFMHGLEDEFYEVRMSACYSLRAFSTFSSKFLSEALNLLMDVLNDYSMGVRLEALETLQHLATTRKDFIVQVHHMHMFLGNLVDNSVPIRSSTRKLLKSVKLTDCELFNLCLDGLLENLVKYPQDEADVFAVLFYMGQTHGDFVVRITKKIIEEIDPVADGNLGFDSDRAAAFIVLVISAPLSDEQHLHDIPPRIFSFAAAYLGRISLALQGIVSQDFLLAYLTECSRYTSSYTSEASLSMVQDHVQGDTSSSSFNVARKPMLQIGDETSEVLSEMDLKEVLEDKLEEDCERMFVKAILAKIIDIWPLVQGGCTHEALKSLRVCKEELLTFNSGTLGSGDALAFTLQYLQIVKLLSKIWDLFFRSNNACGLEILFEKFDRLLRGIRCRFIGLSNKETSHLLELIAVSYVFRFSKEKLSNTISHIETLQQSVPFEHSSFIIEIKNFFHELTSPISNPLVFKKQLDLFSLQQFILSGKITHMKANLAVPNNSSANPLSFIAGLPVSIPLEITLYNISTKSRLWLEISSKESTQFVFLDFELLVEEGDEDMRKVPFVAPFYKTPKAGFFTLMVSVAMECFFEDIHSVKRFGGPKHGLTYLCPKQEVHLSSVSKGFL